MKLLFFVLLCLNLSDAFSQDTSYFDRSGVLTNIADSVKYVRIITKEANAKQFNVEEFYRNGKRKLTAKTNSSSLKLRLEGPCIEFFESGARKTISNYKDGRKTGDCFEYYPQGKLFLHKIYQKASSDSDSTNYIIQEAYDANGTELVTAGNGVMAFYNNTFDYALEHGSIKNGKRDGEWTGEDKDHRVSFVEIYKDGELTTATSMQNNIKYTYSKNRYESPNFVGGEKKYGNFLSKTIRYPAYERENGISGRAIVGFTVGIDGSIGNIAILGSVSPGFSNGAQRIMMLSPNWKPATLYGVPVQAYYSIPINFAVSGQ
ncbi:energy transducer TonB [Mucilaginibacter litoreus]|uniref:Energy transducer TonB n=1 Tax=Mucilaginibacter litoreus TaxID=1048221 RepID=A0ABW3AYV7_9SPHI